MTAFSARKAQIRNEIARAIPPALISCKKPRREMFAEQQRERSSLFNRKIFLAMSPFCLAALPSHSRSQGRTWRATTTPERGFSQKQPDTDVHAASRIPVSTISAEHRMGSRRCRAKRTDLPL